MTQLLIAGIEAVLPADFQCTVKRENPFFTKSGEYTYDVTLRLDNPVNRQLYGFLHRLNKAEAVTTGRQAAIVADGHVVTRGTEIVTAWTADSVSLQIVSAESELNWIIGSDRLIEELDMGLAPLPAGASADSGLSQWTIYNTEGRTIPHHTDEYALPPIRTNNRLLLNNWYDWIDYDQTEWSDDVQDWVATGQHHQNTSISRPAPQPFLCFYVKRMLEALGYNAQTEDHYQPTDQLQESQFAHAILVTTVPTREYAKMFPGWTVGDFLTEVERLTGCVFVTNNRNPDLGLRCDILLRQVFYQNAKVAAIRNVVDQYTVEVVDDEDAEEDFPSSSVAYDLPSHRWQNIMRLPEELMASATITEYPDLDQVKAHINDHAANENVILRDATTGRLYIRGVRRWGYDGSQTEYFLLEVNQFQNLDRQQPRGSIELKITPAPMAATRHNSGPESEAACYDEIISLNTSDTYTETTAEDDTPAADYEEQIRTFAEQKQQTADIYMAFYHPNLDAFTDSYHSIMVHRLADSRWQPDGTEPVASLRLQDLDATHFQGNYIIDTAHRVTVETFDPNRIDVRRVYVVRGRRYVVRDVEETIDAYGRQPRWKATLYPIRLSDTAADQLWVLTDGVWDDGGAWLDDGRWLDDPQ